MSPGSQQKRKANQTQDRADFKKLLRKMKGTDVELNEDQSVELNKIGQIIEEKHGDELQNVFAELSEHSEEKRKTLEQMWNLDIKTRKDFTTDQIKNGFSCRGNRYSMMTYRVALAIYIRSPAAYRSLNSFNILKLPSQRSLQRFLGNHLDAPGECEKYLANEERKYTAMCQQLKSEGKPVPDGNGVLIFDEVKVIAKVLWNSKNNALIGYAMTPEEMSCLHDIYLNLEDCGRPKKTNYVLQFLWRDVCSKFDVLGPYYTSVSSLEHKFIITCVLEAVAEMHNHGFQTKLIICDGASSNLTTIKQFMDFKGIFGHTATNGRISHEVSPKVFNPWTNDYMHFLICPTHQMKNMIGQLYASRQSGTKDLHINGVNFGWKPIRDIYENDVRNAQLGNAQRVPGLKLSYVIRDAWTRLNVKPSKIMQQRPMIAAIQMIAEAERNEAAKASINATADYLEHCNIIFEYGFLSNYTISQGNQRVLESIMNGHHFFEKWLTSILENNPDFKHGSATQKLFVSWQTWDLVL